MNLPLERFRKLPITVDMLLWDGTPERLHHIRAWVGDIDHNQAVLYNEQSGLRIWNTEERCYVECPVGHRITRGPLGEFYPVSPAAIKQTFEPVP